MKNHSLKVNAALNAIRQACSVLFPLVTFSYAAKVLGKENYGIYSFSHSVVDYFALLAGLGVQTYSIREGVCLQKDDKRMTSFCSEIYSINLCAMFVSYILLSLSVAWIPRLRENALAILILSAGILLSTIGTDWINQIREDYLYLTLRYIILQCIAVLATFLFICNEGDLYPFILVTLFAMHGGNLINIPYIRKAVKLRFSFKINSCHLKPLFILFVNSIAVTIYVNSDITILGFMGTAAEVGVYSFSAKLYNSIKQIVNAFVIVTLPRISAVMGNETIYYGYMKKIASGLCMMVLPVTAFISVMGREVILAVGNESYLSGTIALRVLCLALFFAIASSFITNDILIVNRQEKKCLISTVAAAASNVIFNIVWIPRLGMLAAAATTVIAEFVNLAMQIIFSFPYFQYKKAVDFEWLAYVIGTAVVTVICFLVTCVHEPLSLKRAVMNLCVSAILSGLGYFFILVLFRNSILFDLFRAAEKKIIKWKRK